MIEFTNRIESMIKDVEKEYNKLNSYNMDSQIDKCFAQQTKLLAMRELLNPLHKKLPKKYFDQLEQLSYKFRDHLNKCFEKSGV